MLNSPDQEICGDSFSLEMVCDFIVSIGYQPIGIEVEYGIKSYTDTDKVNFEKDKLSISVLRLPSFSREELVELFEPKYISIKDFEEFVIDFEKCFKIFEDVIGYTATPIPDDVKKAAEGYENEFNDGRRVDMEP